MFLLCVLSGNRKHTHQLKIKYSKPYIPFPTTVPHLAPEHICKRRCYFTELRESPQYRRSRKYVQGYVENYRTRMTVCSNVHSCSWMVTP